MNETESSGLIPILQTLAQPVWEYAHANLVDFGARLKEVAIILGAGLLIERLLPAERKQPLRNLIFNLVYAVIFIGLVLVMMPLVSKLTQPITGSYGGLITLPAWPGLLGSLAQAMLFFLIFDFFYYWFHRAQHQLGWLWEQHKLHHAEESLNVTTGIRHHWLEEVFRAFVILLPLSILVDLEPGGITTIWAVLFLWGYFVHLNLKLPLGPLTPVLAGPQLHRLHHSIKPEHKDCNFAAFFPVWDVVFGTYVGPKPGEYPATGLHSGERITTMRAALFSPFVAWYGALRKRAQERRARANPSGQ